VIVSPGTRIALVEADDAAHLRLRSDAGLAPGAPVAHVQNRLAYCGAEYRVYPSMRIADAVRFFSAMHDRWDADALAGDFALAGIAGHFEVRRMKRAYQRALVLAFGAAALPDVLVVENAEEFDEPRTAALLDAIVARVPAAIVTFGGDARPADGSVYTRVVSALDRASVAS
jgi:hypothetical protein